MCVCMCVYLGMDFRIYKKVKHSNSEPDHLGHVMRTIVCNDPSVMTKKAKEKLIIIWSEDARSRVHHETRGITNLQNFNGDFGTKRNSLMDKCP